MKVGRAVLVVCLVGCGATSGDFLGYPETRARRLEEENPRVDDALRDVVTMTEVRAGDYAEYLRLRREGRIYREERRDGWIYWAVRSERHTPLPPERPGSPADAFITVIERYRAPLPNE